MSVRFRSRFAPALAVIAAVVALPAPEAGAQTSAGRLPAATSQTSAAARTSATSTTAAMPAVTATEPTRSFDATGYVPGDRALVPGSPTTGWLPLPPLAVTVNDGLDGLEEEVIPSLVEEEIELGDWVLLDGQTLVCATADAWFDEPTFEAPLTKPSIDGNFRDGGRVNTDVDIDASFRTTFVYDTDEIDTTACDVADTIEDVFDFLDDPFQWTPETMHEEQSFEAEGFTAEIDLTFELNDAADEVELASIEKLEAALGSIETEGTATTNALVQLAFGAATAACQVAQEIAPLLLDEEIADWIGLDDGAFAIGELEVDVAAFAASEPVGDITDCANLVIEAVVLPTEATQIGNAIDAALRQNLAFEQPVEWTGFDADVAVAPAALHSSAADNTMTLEFDFELGSTAPTDPCAAALSWSGGLARSAPPSTSRDFDVEIPHWIVAKSLYELGRQGLFCQLATATIPWSTVPNGTLTVEPGEVRMCNGTICWIAHDDELLVTLPMAFQGNGAGATGTATGALQLYVKPALARRQFGFAVTEIDVVNVVGTLTGPSGVAIDVSRMTSASLNVLAEAVERRLPPVPLLPAVTQLTDDFALELGTIAMNDTYTTLGVDIVPALGWTLEQHVSDPDLGGGSWGSPEPGPIEPLDPTHQDPLP